MTREERITWSTTATPEQWAEACAVSVMGWHYKHDDDCYHCWLDAGGYFVARSLPDTDGWNPIDEKRADFWQVHQRMARGERRLRYDGALWDCVKDRLGNLGSVSLDMTPRDICLAALLVMEGEG